MTDVRLIDANELLRVIDEEIEYGAEYAVTNYQLINKGLKIARKDIKCALTIDAQPVKRGHWILHFDDLFPEESTIECSVCHEHSPADMPHDNFCPNCGSCNGGDAGD